VQGYHLRIHFTDKGQFRVCSTTSGASRVIAPVPSCVPKDYEFSATPCEIEAYDKHEVILLLPIKEWKASTG
jgi:hypothetical protein